MKTFTFFRGIQVKKFGETALESRLVSMQSTVEIARNGEHERWTATSGRRRSRIRRKNAPGCAGGRTGLVRLRRIAFHLEPTAS